MIKTQRRRSNCPVNVALQTFGDSWSLLIVRDIVYFGKKTYGEFLASQEGMATNILAARLAWLEESGILVKMSSPSDRRKDIYSLTEKGLDLIPLLLEIVLWSVKHDPQVAFPPELVTLIQTQKEKMISLTRETVRNGGSVAVGPNSVISQVCEGVRN